MSTWLLSSLALAGPPQVSALPTGAIASGPDEEASWYGAQAGVEQPLGRFGRFGRVAVGGRVMAGLLAPRVFADGGAHLAAQPVVRLWLTDPERSALSAVLGAGLSVEPGVQGIVSAGAALDLSRRGAWRPRFEGGYHLQPGPGRWRLSLGVGLVWQRPPPPPPEPPVVEEEPEPIEITEGLVWMPAPVCDWVEPGEVDEFGVAPLRVWDDDGSRPWGEAADPNAVPRNLIIAAWPGDEVVIGGRFSLTDANGLAVAQPPPGIVPVRVSGGGRAVDLAVAVPEEHALWVAVEPPQPVRVTFPVNTAEIDEASRVLVARVADNRGNWRLEVRGSHSLEGDPVRNAALAIERADAVVEALIADGVPPDQVARSESLDVAASDAPPEELRAALIYPIPGDEP